MEGLCVVLGLVQILSTLVSGEDFNCRTECFGLYDLSQDEYPLTSCDAIDGVLACYSQNQESCNSNFQISLFLGKVFQNQQALNCSPVVSTTVATVYPTCPTVPDIYDFNPSVIMSRPEIEPPADVPTFCTMPHSFTSLRQCSLFMDSQLRAFSSYREGLETCSIPGKWYLLQHQRLTVEVEGRNLEPGSDHTRLIKINVTFYAHSCNPEARSYVARVSSTLPSDFIPRIAAPDNNFTSAVTTTTRSSASSPPLQLISNSNGSMVTLLAAWLNTTIVIRQYASFLSITIQVPGEISYKSEGLCTGCPPHMYVNITHFNDQVKSTCSDDNKRALKNCFLHGGVVNQRNLIYVTNNSYLEACVYNMFKTKSVEVLSMINAVASDAKLLVNVGDPPTPQHSTNPPIFPSSFTRTSSTQDSSPESSSHFLFPSPLFILLSSLLLVRWQLV